MVTHIKFRKEIEDTLIFLKFVRNINNMWYWKYGFTKIKVDFRKTNIKIYIDNCKIVSIPVKDMTIKKLEYNLKKFQRTIISRENDKEV